MKTCLTVLTVSNLHENGVIGVIGVIVGTPLLHVNKTVIESMMEGQKTEKLVTISLSRLSLNLFILHQ